MTRTLSESSTQVNLRMPDRILKGIDTLASENFHDRSSEINSACDIWVKTGGKIFTDTTTLAKIDALEKKVAALEEKLDIAISEMQGNKTLYLKIIETHEHTIKCLLNTLHTSSAASTSSAEEKS